MHLVPSFLFLIAATTQVSAQNLALLDPVKTRTLSQEISGDAAYKSGRTLKPSRGSFRLA